MEEDKIDEIILSLSRRDRIGIIKVWEKCMEELPEGGKKIMKRRISWLKKSLKKKR